MGILCPSDVPTSLLGTLLAILAKSLQESGHLPPSVAFSATAMEGGDIRPLQAIVGPAIRRTSSSTASSKQRCCTSPPVGVEATPTGSQAIAAVETTAAPGHASGVETTPLAYSVQGVETTPCTPSTQYGCRNNTHPAYSTPVSGQHRSTSSHWTVETTVQSSRDSRRNNGCPTSGWAMAWVKGCTPITASPDMLSACLGSL